LLESTLYPGDARFTSKARVSNPGRIERRRYRVVKIRAAVEVSMTRTKFFSFVLGFALASAPALAQQRGAGARLAPHSLNPGISLSAPAATPLDAQIQDNYAAHLRSEQRDLLQQNPSGIGRQELAIGRALNGFTPH
jgi:hypothetical protein